jgi:hypothetical protein
VSLIAASFAAGAAPAIVLSDHGSRHDMQRSPLGARLLHPALQNMLRAFTTHVVCLAAHDGGRSTGQRKIEDDLWGLLRILRFISLKESNSDSLRYMRLHTERASHAIGRIVSARVAVAPRTHMAATNPVPKSQTLNPKIRR